MVYDSYCVEDSFNNSYVEEDLKEMYNITLWDDIDALKDEYDSIDQFQCPETSNTIKLGLNLSFLVFMWVHALVLTYF